MKSNMVQNSPSVMAALQKNILERISLMAQEQIQLEFSARINRSTTNATNILKINPQNPQAHRTSKCVNN